MPDAIRRQPVVAAAVAVALVLRLGFAFGYWVGKPLNHDEAEYLQLGKNLAAGQGFGYEAPLGGREAPERFGRAPVYPVFVAAIALVTAPAALVPAIKIVQCLLGTIAVWLIAIIARRAAGDRAGAVAAWIAASYPPLVWLSAYMLSESLYVAFAMANVLVFGWTIDSDRRESEAPHATAWVAVAGVLGGIAALTRPAHVFFLGVATLWLLARRRVTWAAAFTLGAFLVIAPWTVRNYLAYGRPVLIASEGGITFWTGNHPLSGGEGDMAANPAIKRDNQRLRQSHPGLTPEELEPIYYREAFEAIAARPLWWLGLEARKVFYLFVPIGPSYLLHSRLFLGATWLSYGLLLPFGLIGLVGLAQSANPPRALALLLLSAVVGCLIFLPQERFRIPVIDPALMVGAAALVAGATGRRHDSVS